MTASEHTKTPNHFVKKHFTCGNHGNMAAFNWAVYCYEKSDEGLIPYRANSKWETAEMWRI